MLFGLALRSQLMLFGLALRSHATAFMRQIKVHFAILCPNCRISGLMVMLPGGRASDRARVRGRWLWRGPSLALPGCSGTFGLRKGVMMAIVVLVLWLFTAGAGFFLLVSSNLGRARPASATLAAQPATEAAEPAAAAVAGSAAQI